jgi:LysM repeat protein
MNDDELTLGELAAQPNGDNGDDFWGSTPDWTGTAARPRRAPARRRTEGTGGTGVTETVKGWWSSAMTGGAEATREHRIIDASEPRPDRPSRPAGEYRRADVDPTMFDDLDTDIPASSVTLSGVQRPMRSGTVSPTDDFQVVDGIGQEVAGEPGSEFEEGIDIDREILSFGPESLTTRNDRSRGRARGLDPLLVRLGAIAIVLTLAVPIIVSLASRNDSSDTIATSETSSTTAPPAVDDPGVTLVTAPAPEAKAGDPATLPVAVPPVPVATEPAIATEPPAEALPEIGSDTATKSTPEPDTSDDAEAAQETEPAPETEDQTENKPTEVNDAAEAGDGASRVTDCAVEYTVVAGDYWIRLANGAGVTLAALLEANNATVDTALYPGMTICLPAGSTTPPPPPPVSTPAPTPATTVPATTPSTPSTPPPAPTPTTPPTTAAPTAGGTEGIKQIIRDVWPDDLEARALEIAYRESNYVPTAKNFCCYGLFQIYFDVHKSWLADIGVTSANQLFDPATNARAAYTLYQRSGGWGPWAL